MEEDAVNGAAAPNNEATNGAINAVNNDVNNADNANALNPENLTGASNLVDMPSGAISDLENSTGATSAK